MYLFKHLVDVLDYINTSIDNPTYLHCLEDGVFKSFSSHEFVQYVDVVAASFHAHGVHKGTAVAIVADSSPYWLIIDFALQRLGAISVPIFANISKENLHYEITDAEIEYAFIASQTKFDQMYEIAQCMKLVVTLNVTTDLENALSFESFCNDGTYLPAVQLDSHDIATIIYTSGSTGKPKGVELTHANITSQLHDIHSVMPISSKEVALSFLPLAHIFERMVVTYYLVNGISIYFADDVKNVGNLMKVIRPSVMTVVPRLLDKIYSKMHDGIIQTQGIKGLIAKAALYLAEHKNVTSIHLLSLVFKRLVYSKMLDGLGGGLKYVICGGAPLSPKIERFFVNIGLPLYQGYGLSETSPVICVNTPQAYRFGSCGKKLPSVHVKTESDGELIVQGPNVMRGYHKQPDKTSESIQKGWFHTGDLGRIDDEGYIYIQGRKKELFKTSTGKYVSVVPIEHHLTHFKWIDYAVLVADNRPFVTALIFLDPLISTDSYTIFVNDPKTYLRVQQMIKKVNTHLNTWEQIQRFMIIETLPTIDNHLLTPSMKIARQNVYTTFQDKIDAMYDTQSQGGSL